MNDNEIKGKKRKKKKKRGLKYIRKGKKENREETKMW